MNADEQLFLPHPHLTSPLGGGGIFNMYSHKMEDTHFYQVYLRTSCSLKNNPRNQYKSAALNVISVCICVHPVSKYVVVIC